MFNPDNLKNNRNSKGRNTMFDDITEKIETVMDQLNRLRGHL